jgi:hypothetical protein
MVCSSAIEERPLDFLNINPMPAAMRWVRKVPVSKALALPIIVVGMVTNWLKALCFACLQYILAIDLSLNSGTNKCVPLKGESRYLAFWLHTESVSISVSVVGPPMAMAIVPQSPVVVGTATVHVCTLHAQPRYPPVPSVMRMREVPVPANNLTATIKVVGMVTHRLHAFGLTGLIDLM